MNESIVAPMRVNSTIMLGLFVAVAGAAVMIYEFLAVRFLQRWFGSTLEVWAFEISVCLAGLVVGYSLGGYLGDRFTSWRPLGLMVAIAGVTAIPMEFLASGAARYLERIDVALNWHPFVAAAVSTFIPILALGTVMPQAVRLQVSRMDNVGKSTGWIAAVSTTGSIAGVLLTVMVLLPSFGVRECLYVVSAILIAIGGFAALVGRKRAAPAVLLLLFLNPVARAEVLYEQYSAYHHILVEDRAGTRILRFDNDQQTRMSLADANAGGFEYTDFFHVPVVLNPAMKSALFIGLGGGTGPKAFLRDYPQMQVDVVEIDPQVVHVARTFFLLPEDPRLKIEVRDGRTFLRRAQKTYGAIMMDAYGSGPYGAFIPYHLATHEFFQIVRGKLENGGCFVFNAIGVYPGSHADVVRAIHATLHRSFQAVYVFRARSSYNTVFVAQKIDPAKLEPNGTTNGLAWPQSPWLAHPLSQDEFQMIAAWTQQARMVRNGVIATRVTQFAPLQQLGPANLVLTDNYAPIDIGPGVGIGR